MRIILIFCGIDEIFCEYEIGVFSLFESNPPMGLGSLAAILKKNDFEVMVIDQALSDLNNQKIINQILELNPDILGFSCTSLNIGNSVIIAGKIKKSLPNCFIISGGIHPTLKPSETLSSQAFDAVISGEGEFPLLEIARYISLKGRVEDEIPGLWTMENTPSIKTVYLKNINVPYPERNILNNHLYANKGAFIKKSVCYSVFQSRGCPYQCKFCSKPFYHKFYRMKSIDNTIKELIHLKYKFGITSFSFREDNFTADINHLKNLCYALIDNFQGEIRWECESRATLPFHILELMKSAGCKGIWCGVETIVHKWQRWINKIIPKELIRKFYEDCAKLGISTGAYFLLGYPNQTKKELDLDIKFALELPVEWRYFQIISIFPGSQLIDFYKNTSLYYKVNDDVGLGLTDGFSLSDMISLEKETNNKVRLTPRISLKNNCHL